MQGAAVGIVGYGHIGQAVWKLFRHLGAKGRAVKRSRALEAPDSLDWIGTLDDLDRLMSESDVVVLCAPLDDTTRGMIGADQLAQLSPSGVLVNVGRGPLVDEDALYEALRSEQIAGAVIDVWYQYPQNSGPSFPAARPFWELPNVLMTPHISGVTRETFLGRVKDIATNIRNHVDGRPIERVVYAQA